AWRLVDIVYADAAFTGEGAATHGGRWNPKGIPAVYTAASRSLAALELLVHLGSSDLLQREFAFIPTAFDEKLVEGIEPDALPPDWSAEPLPRSTQAIGRNWLLDGVRPVLRVPSVVIAGEWNYVFNPRHARFGQIRVGAV